MQKRKIDNITPASEQPYTDGAGKIVNKTVYASLDLETTQIYPTQTIEIDGITFACNSKEEIMGRGSKSVKMVFGCFMNGLGDVIIIESEQDLYELFKDLSRSEFTHEIFIHNLDFDFSFIFPILEKYNYHEKPKMIKSASMTIAAEYSNFKLKNTSCVFIGMSVAKIGNWLKLPKLKDDDITRYNQYSLATETAIKYCIRDCEVILKGLYKLKDTIIEHLPDWGKFTLKDIYTMATISYKQWKASIKNATHKGISLNKYLFPYKVKKDSINQSPDTLPEFDKARLENIDLAYFYMKPLSKEEVRLCLQAYIGGIVFPVVGKHKNIFGYDIDSSYPASQVNNKYPLGKMTATSTYPKGRLFIVTAIVTKITCKSAFDWFSSYLKIDKSGKYRMTVTSVDYELIRQMYDIQIRDAVYFTFEDEIDGKELYGEFIYKFYNIKVDMKSRGESGTEVWTALKGCYNGLYGKSGAKIDKPEHIPYLDELGMMRYETTKPKYKPNMHKYYTPNAIFCAAYSRQALLTPVLNKLDVVAYCDTDSLYCNEPLPSEVCGVGLGEFKAENNGVVIPNMYIYAKKTYAYITYKNEIKTTTKGIPTRGIHYANLEEFNNNMFMSYDHMIRCVGGKGMINTYKKVADAL